MPAGHQGVVGGKSSTSSGSLSTSVSATASRGRDELQNRGIYILERGDGATRFVIGPSLVSQPACIVGWGQGPLHLHVTAAPKPSRLPSSRLEIAAIHNMLLLATLMATGYLARPLPAGSPGALPGTTKREETSTWHGRTNSRPLPGRADSCALDDIALMEELILIDKRAKLRALAVQQRLSNMPPEFDPEWELMCAQPDPLTGTQCGEANLEWISNAATTVANDYLDFMGSLIEASDYLEQLHTEKALLRACVPKFGPPATMRRVNMILGPSPAASDAQLAMLARVHRPTVWSEFVSAVAYALQVRAYRTSGGSKDRRWSDCKEWRVLSKLDERSKSLVAKGGWSVQASGQAGGQASGQAGGQGVSKSKRKRELRNLEYRVLAARQRKEEAADGGGESCEEEAETRRRLLPPTRKQRAMARVGQLLAQRASESMEEQLDEGSGRVQVQPLVDFDERQKEIERQMRVIALQRLKAVKGQDEPVVED